MAILAALGEIRTTHKILGSGADGVNYTAIIFGAGGAEVQQIRPSHRRGNAGNRPAIKQ